MSDFNKVQEKVDEMGNELAKEIKGMIDVLLDHHTSRGAVGMFIDDEITNLGTTIITEVQQYYYNMHRGK